MEMLRQSPRTNNRMVYMFTITDNIQVQLNNIVVPMQLDTGASLTIINEAMHQKISYGHSSQIKEAKVRLQTYMGECIPILGSATVHVEYCGQEEDLSLLVIDGEGLVNLANINSLTTD